MVMEGYSLDFAGEMEKAKVESRACARVAVSKWDEVLYDGKGENAGQKLSSVVWYIEWEVLDRELNFNFSNRLFMPDPNRQTFNRQNQPYMMVIKAFNTLGIRGSNPEDFLGAECVIEDTPEIRRPQNTFWKPIAKYNAGMTIEEMIAGTSGEPNLNVNGTEPVESATSETVELPVTGDEFKDLVIKNSVGKTVRSASRGLLSMDEVKENEEWSNQISSGAIFDTLEEENLMKEENNRYVVV